jgi:hypothetical protein
MASVQQLVAAQLHMTKLSEVQMEQSSAAPIVPVAPKAECLTVKFFAYLLR